MFTGFEHILDQGRRICSTQQNTFDTVLIEVLNQNTVKRHQTRDFRLLKLVAIRLIGN